MDKIKFYSENKRKGIVEQVKVQVGQPVKADTPLVKVQTSDGQMVTILADTDGIVGEIKIVESIIVKPGETMFEILKDYEVDKLLKKPRKIGDTLREGLELFGFFNKTTDDIASEYDELVDDEFIGESEEDADEEFATEQVHQADEQVLDSLNIMDEDYITNNLESINEANEAEAKGKSSMTLFKEEILQQYFGDENEQETTSKPVEEEMIIVDESIEAEHPETDQFSDSFDPELVRVNQFAPENDYNLNTEIDMTWSNLDINLETLDDEVESEELLAVSVADENLQESFETAQDLEFEHVAVSDSITEELSSMGALNELEEAQLEREITNLIEEEIIEQKLEEFNDNLVGEEVVPNEAEFLTKFEQDDQEINFDDQSLNSEITSLLASEPITTDETEDQEKNIFLKNFTRDEVEKKPEIEITESEVVNLKKQVNNDLVMVEDLSTNPPVDDIIKINQDNLALASETAALKQVVEDLVAERDRKSETDSEKFSDVSGKIDKIFKEQNILKQKVNGYSRYDDSKIKSRLNKITEKQNAFDQKLGSLSNQKNHDLEEKIKQLIDKQELLVKKIEALEKDKDKDKSSTNRVEVSTTSKAISSIDFEVEVTGLLNLHTLMFDPYSDKNINLGLNSFYLKALRMVLSKFREYDFNENQTISLALISKNRFVFRDIKVFEKTSIGEIAQQVQSARNIDKPKNILLYDLGRHKIVSSKLSLPSNAIISLAVGDVQQKIKNDNVLSDYVNVSVSFDQNFISVFEAMAFTKAFNEIINNPGLLI